MDYDALLTLNRSEDNPGCFPPWESSQNLPRQTNAYFAEFAYFPWWANRQPLLLSTLGGKIGIVFLFGHAAFKYRFLGMELESWENMEEV